MLWRTRTRVKHFQAFLNNSASWPSHASRDNKTFHSNSLADFFLVQWKKCEFFFPLWYFQCLGLFICLLWGRRGFWFFFGGGGVSSFLGHLGSYFVLVYGKKKYFLHKLCLRNYDHILHLIPCFFMNFFMELEWCHLIHAKRFSTKVHLPLGVSTLLWLSAAFPTLSYTAPPVSFTVTQFVQISTF